MSHEGLGWEDESSLCSASLSSCSQLQQMDHMLSSLWSGVFHHLPISAPPLPASLGRSGCCWISPAGWGGRRTWTPPPVCFSTLKLKETRPPTRPQPGTRPGAQGTNHICLLLKKAVNIYSLSADHCDEGLKMDHRFSLEALSSAPWSEFRKDQTEIKDANYPLVPRLLCS